MSWHEYEHNTIFYGLVWKKKGTGQFSVNPKLTRTKRIGLVSTFMTLDWPILQYYIVGSMAGCQVILGLFMSHVVYGNGLVQVMFVSTRIRTGCVRVEFFQPICVIGHVSVNVFFATLNPNLTLIWSVDMICQAYMKHINFKKMKLIREWVKIENFKLNR